MHLDKALPDAVSIYHVDFEWIQPLDYEHVPFRCRRCHAHGHLFRDCPLNSQSLSKEAEDKSELDGFTKVPSRRKHSKKSSAMGKKPSPSSNTPSTSNIFFVLSNSDRSTKTNLVSPDPTLKPSTPSGLPNLSNLKPTQSETLSFDSSKPKSPHATKILT